MKLLLLILSLCLSIAQLKAQDLSATMYTLTELSIKTSTCDVYGSLTVPEKLEKGPVVIIIPGSGPTDRDGNNNFGMVTNAYKMLASELINKGISCLRYDKRGIGKSKAGLLVESDMRFEMGVDDAIAWIELLKQDKRFTDIIIVGHSEGSLIGMIAANKTKVSKYISIAGVAKTADLIIKEQLSGKLSQGIIKEAATIMDSLKQGKTVSNINPMLVSLFRPSVQPYLISWFKYDPIKEISKIEIPVLIVQGTTDMQVPTENAHLLVKAKPNAKLLVLEKMNHILKESESDHQQNMKTYFNPILPLKTGLVEGMVEFITR